MDVARDLVDRQLVDQDGRECGRVDDLWIGWDKGGAHLGALATGTAVVLDQLGAAGRLLQHIGGKLARASFAVEWDRIVKVERSRVVIIDKPIATHVGHSPSPGRRRYSAIARLTVIDRGGEERAMLDLRSDTALGGKPPSILGLIACRRTWLRTLGMKRYDATGVPLANIQRHARFIPWDAIEVIDDAIRLRVAFTDLPRLNDAPDPGPPPIAQKT